MSRFLLSKTIAFLIAILAALAFVTASLSTPAPTRRPAAMLTTSPIDCAQWVSGTIHWVSSSTWATIDDNLHRSTGIASVIVYSDHLRVNFTFTADTVGSLQVTADESFALADVTFGASVQTGYTDIYAHMPSYGSTPVPPSLLTRANANIWLLGVFGTCPPSGAAP